MVLAALALALLGLGGWSSDAHAESTITAHGSAEQVYATDLAPSASVTLLDAAGGTVATEQASAEGGVLFRDVTPGDGYRLRLDADRTLSDPVTVHTTAAAPWDPEVYDQSIASDGYQYLTTRDGTQLAISVHPPTSPASLPGLPEGTPLPNGPDYLPPYPTVIEYSGYGYAKPDGPVNGIATLANLMGFAVVDVNMRGTGCSGGAYDFFEPLQQLDAYDVIETIARQPWVKGHQVGMIGISYGGISQLFAAQNNPPSLAAIAPLSVIDSVATTLYPGGILNNGFAVNWAEERAHEALPAGPDTGQPYAWDRIQGGDQTCADNQALHGEATDLLGKVRANDHYNPEVADPLDPITFVKDIHVPVFLACQWQDEQTGGHCPMLVRHFTGTQKKWFTFTNGAHVDSLDPTTFNRWYDFLSLYVAHQPPMLNAAVLQAAAPLIYQEAMGLPPTDISTLPVDPVQLQPTYAGALKAFEALPRVRVLFDNGAGRGKGDPYPGYERSFSDFPVPGTTARSFYLRPHGEMGALPLSARADTYTSDPHAVPATDYTGGTGGGGLWGNASQWSWNWQPYPGGNGVSYVSPALAQSATVVGSGAVEVWVKSSTPDVDLQATVSEIRPDGKEVFVQNGWMRASERKLSYDPGNIFRQASTLLEPVPSFLASDVQPMPANKYVKVTIPLYYQGHAYRAGSRIRLTITAPNGTQPIWSFDETQPPTGTATVSIAHSPGMPSRLVLPVVSATVPTALPACGSLRNEPCRDYVAVPNRESAP
ncbi:MAG TPA: CocE/NonD family hydrolase [Nocardioides sp.]|nr:CocE/NonD family hydrolase [Nocardioides sp.]